MYDAEDSTWQPAASAERGEPTVTTISQVAEVVDRAATDPAFRQELLSAPAATLRAAGIAIPEGSEVRVVENTAGLRHLVLPGKPEGFEHEEAPPSGSAPGAAASTAEKLHEHARLVVDTWSDGDLRARLLNDPRAVLAERGIAPPDAVELRVVETTDRVVYLALPPAVSR
jgi:hypothetical protein